MARAEANMDLSDVFMLFEKRDALWHVSFTRPLGRGPFPRTCTFAYPDKIRSLYERFGTSRILEDRSAFELAIERGSGCVMLSLGREQYSKLLRR